MTHNPRSARDRAADHIQTVRDTWYPTPLSPGDELDAIPTDLLAELHDERRMTKRQGCTYEHHLDAVYSAVACPACQGGRT